MIRATSARTAGFRSCTGTGDRFRIPSKRSGVRRPVERADARGDLVEDDAERPQIRTGIDIGPRACSGDM